ncbi:phthiocerol/phthiodiolone dimycocerosyl transferase family protein [Nocardia sp. NPDC004722]
MKYRLGTIDQGFLPTEVTVSYVAICTGEVDADLLRHAFTLTCRRFPMLTGRIELTAGGAQLHIREHGTAPVETSYTGVADWLTHGTGAFAPASSLAKLDIVCGPAETAVALRVSHAIGDAHLGFELLTELWGTATALEAGTADPDPAPRYPRSLEDLLTERGAALPDPSLPELTGLRCLAPTPSPGAPGLRLAPGERITLSATETRALLRYAREQGTTVHALLSAAIIRAERTLIGETSDATGELPMVIAHAVDLRPYLSPPARRVDATNGLGCAPTVTFCAPDSDLTVLGKEVKAQITHGIDGGIALATMLAASHGPGEDAREHAANIITNWGVVPALDTPKALRITDFRGFATGGTRPEISYFVYTFDDRLSIEFTHSEPHHPAALVTRLARAVSANLTDLIPAWAQPSGGVHPRREPVARQL